MRDRLIAALDAALASPCWRPEDIEGLLRGPARFANGGCVAVCEGCGKPEWMDGLVPTERDGDDIPVLGGNYCPQCRAKGVREP